MIKTSVIIPVYNAEDYLEKCLQSVISQTQKEMEIIIVNDGSVDKSAEIIESYQNKYSYIKTINQSNQKLGAARNAGLKIAEGEYIYFLDADDYIDPQLLEKCYEVSTARQLDFLMFDSHIFAEKEDRDLNAFKLENYDRSDLNIPDRKFIGKDFWFKYHSLKVIYTNAYLLYIRKEFLISNNLYFEEGVFYEDNDWIIRMFQADPVISYINKKFYYRRIHSNSIMTVSYNKIHLISIIKICEKILKMLETEKDPENIIMDNEMLISLLYRYISINNFMIENEELDNYKEYILDFLIFIFSFVKKIEIISKIEGNEKILNLINNIFNLDKILLTDNEKIRFINLYKGNDEEKIKRIFWIFPFDKDVKIGIYGTGRYCDLFLAAYKEFVGEISANLIYFNTEVKPGEKYNEGEIYKIEEAERMELDYLIICSLKYAKELTENAEKTCKNKTVILTIPSLLKEYL